MQQSERALLRGEEALRRQFCARVTEKVMRSGIKEEEETSQLPFVLRLYLCRCLLNLVKSFWFGSSTKSRR